MWLQSTRFSAPAPVVSVRIRPPARRVRASAAQPSRRTFTVIISRVRMLGLRVDADPVATTIVAPVNSATEIFRLN